MYNLPQPPLTRVSKQLRAEALPIFYGENEFNIRIPAAENEWNDIDNWDSFVLQCEVFAAGGLRFKKKLHAMYHEPVWEDSNNYLLGFDLGGKRDVKDREYRIGKETTDWTDREEVLDEFYKTFNAVLREDWYGDLRELVPVQRVADALFLLARLCTSANSYAELEWDYGH